LGWRSVAAVLFLLFSRALRHCSLEGLLYPYPNEFRHSTPEALHTKRRERHLLAKDGTKTKESILLATRNLLNTFRPVLVLVPSSLSRQLTDLGTSTKPIFKSLLKKKDWEYLLLVCIIRLVHVCSFRGCLFFPPHAYTCL
jgi:hypothetical protein